MVQHEVLQRMEDSTRGIKHRQTSNPSFTECVTRVQKLQGGSSPSTETSPVDSGMQSWEGRARESSNGKGVIASMGRVQGDVAVGRRSERPAGDADKDQSARSKLRRSSWSKNDDRLQRTVDAGLQGSGKNDHSADSSPIHPRPVHLLPRRPRAATFSHPSSCNSDSFSPFASPTSLGELTRNGARKGKSITALCSMMQKQGGFDCSPVLARVRHHQTTGTGLPCVVGISPVVYRNRHISPYNTSLAKRQVDLSSSRGIDLSPSLQRHSDPLPLSDMQAATKSTLGTKQHHKKTSLLKDAQGAKNATSSKRPSSAKNRKDKALIHDRSGHKRSDSDSSASGHAQQTCVQVALAPPSLTNGQSHLRQDVTTATQSGLGIPAITVRAATPCLFDNQHVGGEEKGDDGEPSLTEQFAIRAELAEVLRKLSQDVQDIVHATTSINKRD